MSKSSFFPGGRAGAPKPRGSSICDGAGAGAAAGGRAGTGPLPKASSKESMFCGCAGGP
eukprot:CAMPEP_0203920490 /NCGR_PEP_ID=MMETSP0359-20131031/60782_1 /ASSEMBLY_ACC=CAM_ASM_000338 /TAXON_ID=268821 /ORGANISM="Scrippsiella Hangoei, Strain SHTV-5" /LENGTH=58 /DNA_ID=CAMNT_0050848003 /DNA_START=137 /DNA_END=310 /DNA_ORIENTATION=+